MLSFLKSLIHSSRLQSSTLDEKGFDVNSKMYIIAGLGNPGDKYAGTRHNVGFMTIDALADKYNIEIREKAHKALIGKGMIEGNKVILVKPQTYMNLSGESIRSVMDFYKADISEFMVIYDDISLEPGAIRVRKKGSAGGHNGIKNIILHLGSQEFPRIRVGVGEKPEKMDLADYVLGHFLKEEKEAMEKGIKAGCDAVVCMMNEGADAAMNKFNGSSKKPKPVRDSKSWKKEAAEKATEQTSEAQKAVEKPAEEGN